MIKTVRFLAKVYLCKVIEIHTYTGYGNLPIGCKGCFMTPDNKKEMQWTPILKPISIKIRPVDYLLACHGQADEKPNSIGSS